MPEWPEGIPNPHPHVAQRLGISIERQEHEAHHRAEEALLAYIEGQAQVLATAQMRAGTADAAFRNCSMGWQRSESDVQALLAVRDAAQKVWGQRNDLAPWTNIEGEAWEAMDALLRSLQGLPEHLRGQA